MRLDEFRSTIENNSAPGAILVFYEKCSPNTHYLDKNKLYKWRGEVKRHVLTITILPSDDGSHFYRDSFLYYVDRMMGGFHAKPDTRVRIMLVDQDGCHLRGYLTDDMWSHMCPGGDNTFAFDNPVPAEELDRSLLRYYIDAVANGSMLNGN